MMTRRRRMTQLSRRIKKGKKRPLGNREADEVVILRALNQQLMKRIQSQAGLEPEVARLKCLLVNIRERIEGEIGNFPYQKQSHTEKLFL
ncbi:hypothetical protein Hanom_Chr03g00216511 [Helianthus anomalus]